MKTCQREQCKSDRLLEFSGKVSDMFHGYFRNHEHDGYVPRDLNIGGGDYLEMTICLECGQTQGSFPVPEETILKGFGVE